MIVVQRNPGRIGRGDVDDGHPAVGAAALGDGRAEGDRGIRVRDRRGLRLRDAQAETQGQGADCHPIIERIPIEGTGAEHPGGFVGLLQGHGERTQPHHYRHHADHRTLPQRGAPLGAAIPVGVAQQFGTRVVAGKFCVIKLAEMTKSALHIFSLGGRA